MVILIKVKQRRMWWAGHVARMGVRRRVYRVLAGKPEGKRPLGRPRLRWEDNIKMDLQEITWGPLSGLMWLRLYVHCLRCWWYFNVNFNTVIYQDFFHCHTETPHNAPEIVSFRWRRTQFLEWWSLNWRSVNLCEALAIVCDPVTECFFLGGGLCP